MGSVMSQDEVEALLKGVESDQVVSEGEEDEEYDPDEAVSFDLTAPGPDHSGENAYSRNNP